jgi:hypothetical protein
MFVIEAVWFCLLSLLRLNVLCMCVVSVADHQASNNNIFITIMTVCFRLSFRGLSAQDCSLLMASDGDVT